MQFTGYRKSSYTHESARRANARWDVVIAAEHAREAGRVVYAHSVASVGVVYAVEAANRFEGQDVAYSRWRSSGLVR